MRPKDWTGKYATVIKTGEVVEVISYDSDRIQAKTAQGGTAIFKINEVIISTLQEGADFGQKIPLRLLNSRASRLEAQVPYEFPRPPPEGDAYSRWARKFMAILVSIPEIRPMFHLAQEILQSGGNYPTDEDSMTIIDLETELTRLEIVRTQAEKDAALRFPVLLADDSPEDRMLAKFALDKSTCLKPVAEVRDGVEVMEYLSGYGKYRNRELFPFPELLLLDIQMPRLNGLQVLEWLQKQNFPELRVVMLSASLDPENIKKALALGADYYQAKTSGLEMEALVRRLELLMVLMHHREPKRFMKNPPPSPAPGGDMQSYTTIKLADARGDNWKEVIAGAANGKRNFILVLRTEDELERLWSALGTTNIVPERVHRWGILAMAEALETEDYAFLLENHKENAVYLIEQLTLERNAPPATQRYMLYCELRGIISDHGTIEDAGISLLSYLNFFKRARLLPLAGIYEYLNNSWVRVKKLTSDPLPQA